MSKAKAFFIPLVRKDPYTKEELLKKLEKAAKDGDTKGKLDEMSPKELLKLGIQEGYIKEKKSGLYKVRT